MSTTLPETAPMPTAMALATAFCRVLREWLPDNTIARIVLRDELEPEFFHVGDFCDENQALLDAIDFPWDVQNEAHTSRIDEVMAMARAAHYDPAQVKEPELIEWNGSYRLFHGPSIRTALVMDPTGAYYRFADGLSVQVLDEYNAEIAAEWPVHIDPPMDGDYVFLDDGEALYAEPQHTLGAALREFLRWNIASHAMGGEHSAFTAFGRKLT